MRESLKKAFPPREVIENVGELKNDVATLVQLQLELFRVDLRECARRLVMPVVLLVIVVVGMLSCVPLGLLGLADALVANNGLPRYAALWIIVLGTLLIGLVAALYCWRKIREALSTFERSSEEFAQNIRWIKRVLDRS